MYKPNTTKITMVRGRIKLFKRMQKLNYPLYCLIFFGVLTVFFIGYIIYWWVTSNNTVDLLDNINASELVGVEVQASEATDGVPKTEQFPFLPVDFNDLLERNDETVGWLRFDAVGVNMPFVQTTDNDFYLEHDIDKKRSILGWVFADARVNMEHTDYNTVLFGHNAGNQQMFGSLKDIFKVDPERKEQDEVIQVTTKTSQQVYEVVSVYVTDYEDWKYVNVDFTGEEHKREFNERMREKNEIPLFDRDDLSVHDKYLTFSTCYGPVGTTKRMVVHARLVAEIPNEW